MLWVREYHDRLDLCGDGDDVVATVIITWHIFDVTGRRGRDHKKRKLFTIVMVDGTEKKVRSAHKAIEWAENRHLKNQQKDIHDADQNCQQHSPGCSEHS